MSDATGIDFKVNNMIKMINWRISSSDEIILFLILENSTNSFNRRIDVIVFI